MFLAHVNQRMKRSHQDDQVRCLLGHPSRSWRKEFYWSRLGAPQCVTQCQWDLYHQSPLLRPCYPLAAMSQAAMNGCWWGVFGANSHRCNALQVFLEMVCALKNMVPRRGYIMESFRVPFTLLWCVRDALLQNCGRKHLTQSFPGKHECCPSSSPWPFLVHWWVFLPLAAVKPPTVKSWVSHWTNFSRQARHHVGGKVQGCVLNQNRREMNQESVYMLPAVCSLSLGKYIIIL